MALATRLAWLPLPILLALIVGLFLFDSGEGYAAPVFRFAMQLVVMACAACLVGFISAREFLAHGAPAPLLLGCGALAFGLSGVLANLVGMGNPNTMVTIHNLCVWLSAMLHFLGVGSAQMRPLQHRRRWLLLAYAGTLALVSMVSAASAAPTALTPIFFIQGLGGTPVRQFVLGSAVLLFAVSGWLLSRPVAAGAVSDGVPASTTALNWMPAPTAPESSLPAGRRWYAFGLMLIALGLAGVLIQKTAFSALSWAAMSAQWLGSAYLVVAVLLGAPGQGALQAVLAPATVRASQRWLLAAVAVAAAVVVRLVFLDAMGTDWPFALMYPAVLAAALYGGWPAALFAIGLALLVTNYFWVGAPNAWLPRDAWELLPSLLFAALASAMVALALRLQRARTEQVVAEHARARAEAQRRTDLQLQHSEQRYRALFDSVEQGVCLCEMVCNEAGQPTDYRFLDVNPAFPAMTGLTGPVVGRTARELVPGLEDHWVERYGQVALGGKAVRFELPSPAMGRHFDVFAAPTAPRGQFVVLFTDVTARKQAEEQRRLDADMDAFRVLLADTLRALSDPAEVLRRGCQLLGARLAASRAHYAEIVEGEFVIEHQYTDGVPATEGRFPVGLYGLHVGDSSKSGQAVVVDDVMRFELSPALLAAYQAGQVRAVIGVPLFKGGTLVAGFGVHQSKPRRWSAHEVALVEEAAERTWEALQRARAQAELRRGARRNHYALTLANALRPLSDAAALQAQAAALLGKELRVERAVYFEIDGGDYVLSQHHAVGVAPLTGRYPAASFGERLLAEYAAGRTAVNHDVAADPALSPAEKTSYAAVSVAAYIGVPLIKDGAFVAGLSVHAARKRTFRPDEIELVELTAEQTWSATERLRSEQALRRSEGAFRTLGEALPDQLWMAWADGAPIYQNPAWQAYTGLDQAKLMKSGWLDMNHPEDQPLLSETWNRALREPAPFAVEHRMRRHDGAYRWFYSRTAPVFDEQGRLVRWVGVASDVHDRKLHSEQLAAAAAREQARADELATVMQAIPVAVWVARDPDCSVVTGNDAGCALLRMPPGSNMSLTPAEGASALDLRILRDGVEVAPAELPMQRCAKSGWHEPAEEFELVWPDGQRRCVMVNAVPLHDAAGHQTGVISVGVDLNERKHIEQQLKDADRRKNEFIALLGHELRNPLAPVRSAVEAIGLVCPELPEVEWARGVIDRQMQQMSRLIDDLLDVSRITQGLITLELAAVELRTVVHAALETSRPLIEQHGHELAVQLPAEPVLVNADAARLSQVLSNLLNNAARYTDTGGRVALRVAIDDHYDEPGVTVTVSDSGIGIPASQLDQVFEPFEQLDRGADRSRSGLGIGLTLVKRLVEMHGGQVEARSDGEGRGSEFALHLPRLVGTAAVHAAPPPRVAPALSGAGVAAGAAPAAGRLRILIADDNRDAGDTLQMYLSLLGHEVRTAGDGQDALRQAADFKPQAVLLDLGMPLLDGLETARRLRAREAEQGDDEKPPLVLIATTGWGQPEDRERSRAAGFDHHLVKPVDPNALLHLLSSRPPAAAPSANGGWQA